jgi:nitrogen fixation protein NifX
MRRLRLVDRSEAHCDAEIPGGLRIAFATTDMKRVDAHFGSAPVLMIYEIGMHSHRLLEAVAFDETGRDRGNADRLEAKVQALRGCAMLFVLAIGGGAAARIVGNRIYPVKLAEPEAIASVIDRMQTMLKEPPPWLCKILQQNEFHPTFAND